MSKCYIPNKTELIEFDKLTIVSKKEFNDYKTGTKKKE